VLLSVNARCSPLDILTIGIPPHIGQQWHAESHCGTLSHIRACFLSQISSEFGLLSFFHIKDSLRVDARLATPDIDCMIEVCRVTDSLGNTIFRRRSCTGLSLEAIGTDLSVRPPPPASYSGSTT